MPKGRILFEQTSYIFKTEYEQTISSKCKVVGSISILLVALSCLFKIAFNKLIFRSLPLKHNGNCLYNPVRDRYCRPIAYSNMSQSISKVPCFLLHKSKDQVQSQKNNFCSIF